MHQLVIQGEGTLFGQILSMNELRVWEPPAEIKPRNQTNTDFEAIIVYLLGLSF